MCARLASPGRGLLPPPIIPAVLVPVCGLRNGRWRSSPAGGSSATREWILVTAIDAVFDDDVTLREYAGDALALAPLAGSEQYFAVAMALGSRTLLNVVDRAIRELRREHPEIPTAFNRKTVAHVGREEEAASGAREPVPEMDRSLARIRRRGVLRVGVHPGVRGLCTEVERREALRGARAGDRAARRAARLRRSRAASSSCGCTARGV